MPPTGDPRPGPARRGTIVRLRRLLDMDVHVFQTLLLRGWSILAGGVMVLFVPLWFKPVDQGYFYTFNSLIAVQIFFELGMGQIVVQLVSHEAAHLHERPDGGLAGDRASISRLASLVQLLTRWYRIAAFLFAVLGSVAGIAFFARHGQSGSGREPAIWTLLVLFTAINLGVSPALAVLEGFGRIGDVARLRLVQSILGYLLMWAGLSLGAGLYAAPVLSGVAVACTLYWLHISDRRIRWLREVRRSPADPVLQWRRDVLPLQWRIALSWASGYLILQLLVPMAFSFQGAIAAGRLGLTLTIFNSLLSVGLSWVNARLPILARQLARGEREEALGTFRDVAWRSVAATLLGTLVAITVVEMMPAGMRDRFADIGTMTLLGVATVVNCATYAMATFIRAHKEEPLLAQSVVCAAVMVPTLYLLAHVGLTAMAAGFVGIIVIVALPWTMAVFRRYRDRSVPPPPC
jgi:hypothetical protein